MMSADTINELPKTLEQLRRDKATHIQNLLLIAARNLGIFSNSEAQLEWLTDKDNSPALRSWLEEVLQKKEATGKDLSQISKEEEFDLARAGLQYFFSWQEEVPLEAFNWEINHNPDI